MTRNEYPGTTFDASHQKWKARLTRNGKTRHLGAFNTQQEAYQAVLAAKRELHGADPDAPQAAIVESRKNTTVAQHNLLVEARLPLSLVEARLFVLLLRGLRRDQAPTASLVLIAELMPGALGGASYESLRVAVEHLLQLQIRLPVLDNKKDVRTINLMQSMEVNSAEGFVLGAFTEQALPYLTRLTDNFTVGVVEELLSLKSANSHPWYWLMKSLEFRSPVTVTVQRLREMTTEAGTYYQYADFRNKVLRPSIDELNSLSFEITFSENRKGRVVDSVRFNIGSKKTAEVKAATPRKQLEAPKPQLTDLQQKVSTRLMKLKLTPAQIRKVLEVVVGEEPLTKLLRETYPILRDHETKAKPNDNVAASTMTLLKSTFPAIWAAN